MPPISAKTDEKETEMGQALRTMPCKGMPEDEESICLLRMPSFKFGGRCRNMEEDMPTERGSARTGPSSVQAGDAQILKMVRESSRPFESLKSFEQDLTFETAEKVFKSADVEFGRNQMASLGMLSEGCYTNLALLYPTSAPRG